MPLVRGAICEKCGEMIYFENTAISNERLKKHLREKGWSIGKKVLCDVCKKTIEQKKEKKMARLKEV